MPFRKKPTRGSIGLKKITAALEERVGLFNRVSNKQEYIDEIIDLARTYQSIYGGRVNGRILGLMASSYVKGLAYKSHIEQANGGTSHKRLFSVAK